jgi:hypothetical protein
MDLTNAGPQNARKLAPLKRNYTLRKVVYA